MQLDIKHKKRLVYLGVFLFSLFALLILRFYQIQILEFDHWSAIADRQHFFFVKEPFHRGSFLV